MTNDERLYDYLDELLEGEEAREAESAIARDPARFAEIARRRALLYRPYAVPAARARKPALRLARYAAAFLLGVLTPLLLGPLASKPPEPKQEPAKFEVVNRRLR